MKFQPNSLKGRWLINIFASLAVIMITAILLSSAFIYSYYHSSVTEALVSRAKMAVSVLSDYANSPSSDFEKASQNFLNVYVDKGMAEVQILSADGKVIASTLGVAQDYPKVDASERQKISDMDMYVYECKVGDEKLEIVSSDMHNEKGKTFGSVRCVSSISRVNNQIIVNISVITSIGLFIILLVLFLGLIFLRSITGPVKRITAATKSIASGKFDDRIEHSGESEEISELCDSINSMASELATAESVKNEFISSVSHELRTPLTAIKGWGETILAAGASDPIILGKGMNIIINETQRMEGLVEDLLDFSRIESGRLKINPVKCDIVAELEELVIMYRQVAEKLGINLVYLESAPMPPVMADPARIRQVFINVIDNAIKYSNEGGSVTVEVSQHDVFVKITVRDMGCGIKKEDLPHVKEKFYKANKTVRGSGIGLAVADEIMRQHNGFLEIESVEGYGTTVMIELPFISTESEKEN